MAVSSDRTYRCINRTIAMLFALLRWQITVRGDENIPAHGAAVIACNHTSFIDFTFVGYAARQRSRFARFLCKRDIFNNRFSGPPMRAMGHIPVDRPWGAVAFRTARSRLRNDQLVCAFPEATISHSFVLRPFKRGAAALAISERVPLIPAIVWGSHRIATVDRRFSLRPGRAVSIIIGEPLWATDGETPAALTERLREQMACILAEAIKQYPQQPRGESDRWWLPHEAGGSAPDVETGLRLDHEGLERIGQLID